MADAYVAQHQDQTTLGMDFDARLALLVGERLKLRLSERVSSLPLLPV
jgi:hypothetical protein